MRRLVVGAIALFLCLVGGCGGDARGRHAISGTVKIDGKPLDTGNISFQPIDGQNTAGGGTISDGRYHVPREGGLVPGKYAVIINSPVPGTGGGADENSLPGDPPAPPKEMIPAEWNSESEHTIEVKSEGPFDFDFDVSPKSKQVRPERSTSPRPSATLVSE